MRHLGQNETPAVVLLTKGNDMGQLATQGTTDLARPVGNKGGIQRLLESPAMMESIRTVLPRHLTPTRVVKMVLIAASRQPRLLECTGESICKAVITASELGLDCSGTLGSGYMVPYRNNKKNVYEAQFIPGYRGLIDLARRGGEVQDISAHVVYRQDEFEFELGTNPTLRHKPYIGADRDEGKKAIIGAYMTAKLKDTPDLKIEFMTISQIEGIRKRSKAKDDGPWVTDYAEMCRKTVVRRGCKYLPLSVELEKALRVDDEQFVGSGVTDLIDPPPVAPPPRRLSERKTQTPPAQDAEEPPTEQQEDEPAGDQDQAPPANESAEPDAHEKLVIMLMETFEVDRELAIVTLDRAVKPMSKKPVTFLQLPDDQLPVVEAKIRKGEIKPEKK